MPPASQIGNLARRAIAAGFPVGSTDFNKFVQNNGSTSGFPLTRSSGFGLGSTFIGGNPVNAYGNDASGRPLPSAKARDILNAEAVEANRFDPELLEVTKSDPIQAAVTEALEQSRADSASRRESFDEFKRTANDFRQQSQAEIDRDASETFNTDRLRDFLGDENQRFETASQNVAQRASQFLRRRLDEQMMGGAGSGAPIGDSSDLRNRTMQSFIDINLPLQQQLSDRRIQQAQQLKGLDVSLAGRSQAARAALLNQIAMPLQFGQQFEGNDLMSLARIQAIDDANNIRGVQGDVPNDFTGLQSFGISTPESMQGRVSSPRFNNGFNNGSSGRTISPFNSGVIDNSSRVDRNGFPAAWGSGNSRQQPQQQPQQLGRRIKTPSEARERNNNPIKRNPFNPRGKIGSTSIFGDRVDGFST